MKKNNYLTSELLKDLKRVIFDIAPTTMVINGLKVKILYNRSLSDKKLSLILCGYENRIKRI